MMVADGYKHLRLGAIGGVQLIEVVTREIQGPDLAKEFIGELSGVVVGDDDRPILVDLGRVRYLSSMGYSALFKAVKCARERGRAIRFCDMHEDVRVGADAVNMTLVVAIHESRAAALEAFARA
jgi:anti-anti-sigma regulatory factor